MQSENVSTCAGLAPAAHLLLVDDDRLVLATLTQGLRSVGYQVSSADSAEDALMQLDAGLAPDLALLDMRLPGADGLALAAQLRTRGPIPFLVLSAYSDEAMVQEAAQLGAQGYLVKPVDPEQIAPTLCTALERAREQAALRAGQAQLQNALDGNREINVAIGITMMQYRLPRQAAFDMLRAAARAQRRKLADLAHDVIQASNSLHQGSAAASLS